MGKVTNPPEIRELLRARDGDDCWLCGKPVDFTRPVGTLWGPSIDHVIPKAAGGSNDLPNLRLAHAYPCNHAKGAKWEGTDYSSHPPKPVAPRSRRSQRRQVQRDPARGPQGGLLVPAGFRPDPDEVSAVRHHARLADLI